MLSYLNSRFSNLSFKVKIELYLLPILVILLFIKIYSFEEHKTIETNNQSKFEKSFSGSYFNIIKDIEKFCLKNKINLLYLSNKKKTIKLRVKANLKKLIKLINKIEFINNYSKIRILNISKSSNSNKYFLELTISFEKLFIKRKIEIKKETKKRPLKLHAIVGGFVLINKKWLSLGDKVSTYKIVSIDRNYVLLKHQNKTLKLEVFKNEKIK